MTNQLKLAFWRKIGCLIVGHKFIYSPQFCLRCHLLEGFYPIRPITIWRSPRLKELSQENYIKFLQGKPFEQEDIKEIKYIYN